MITKNIIISGIIAVIVIGVTIGIISTVISNTQHIERCTKWNSELDVKKEQWQTRAGSLGGILDLSGEIRSDRLALDTEIDQYNAECTNTITHYADR